MKRNLLLLVCFMILFIGVASFQQVFAEIQYHSVIGSKGNGNNDLYSPSDVVYSEDEKLLYVVDTQNNRINVFEHDGDHDYTFGTFCDISKNTNCNDDIRGADEDGDGQFDKPVTAAIDDSENLFVVDSDNSRIQRFDNGRYEMKFGSDDSDDDDYLDSPQGIAILDPNKIFISSSITDSIHVFDYTGKFLYDFDTFDRQDSFTNPSHLLITSDDRLFVADSGNDRIVIFELVDRNCPSGTKKVADKICFVESFGKFGRGDGEFDSPSGLAFDESDDRLYVADTDNNRIVIFELVDRNCPSGTKEVADKICFVESFGKFGRSNGQFDSPSGLAINESDNKLYVADTDNNRIQILSFDSDISTSLDRPENLRAIPTSPTSVVVTWDPSRKDDSSSKVNGYKIEYKTGSGSYEVLDEDTGNPRTMFTHSGLESNTTYTYRVYALGPEGTSNYSSDTVRTKETKVPSGLIAEAISPKQVRLTWHAPSNTDGLSISGYEVKRAFSNNTFKEEGDTNAGTTTFVVSGLETDRKYSFAVSAKMGFGTSNKSDTVTITPRNHSVDNTSFSNSYIKIADSIPDAPTGLTANQISNNQINLSWHTPSNDDEVIGYKIQYKKNSEPFLTLTENTKNTATIYQHNGVTEASKHTYKVYARNSAGVSAASEPFVISSSDVLEIASVGRLEVHEERTVMFMVRVNDSVDNVIYSLASNSPSGSKIDPNNGTFTWTPNSSQGGKTYTFDVVAKNDSDTDRQQVTILVKDTVSSTPDPVETIPVETPPPESIPVEPKDLSVAPFVDSEQDPQYYIDRYNNETSYKEWFDTNYSQYSSIYHAVGLDEPPDVPASFVDSEQDPQYYIDRYNNETSYKEWFDTNYSQYSSIYHAVGLEETEDEIVLDESVMESKEIISDTDTKLGECGKGTELVDGTCVIIEQKRGGGCLIATAAYGSEMSQQIQLLREIRDGKLMSTTAGAEFMNTFNHFYYSFSPQIADYQRDNPAFREIVKFTITPLVTSLGIMSLADSEQEILGYGIAVIVMNAGLYLAIPVMLTYGIIHRMNKR